MTTFVCEVAALLNNDAGCDRVIVMRNAKFVIKGLIFQLVNLFNIYSV